MREHRYRGLVKTVRTNLCGDGYDAQERGDEIISRSKALIDKAYEKGVEKGRQSEHICIYEFDIWDFDKGIILAHNHETAVAIFKDKYPDVPVLNTDTDEYDCGV